MIAFLSNTLLPALVGLLKITTVLAQFPNPIANLSYGSFQGFYDAQDNITYFRKIPFAAPPIGVNRFRAPQPVEPITNGTYNTNQPFDYCPQRTENGTEDCLYLGLYSRPWAGANPGIVNAPLRPVVVFFFGGGFIEGGGSFDLPPSNYPTLNVSTENDFIMVLPNYRVNAFGFLPGSAIASDPTSDYNVGLLDQHAVLQWIHDNIAAFGGDPDQVTVWGQSAGAASVVAQVIASPAYNGHGLFQRALASSPFWPKTYRYDAPEAEWIFDTFAELSNCSTANGYKTGSAQLACLKMADLQDLRTAALAISGSHTYNTSSYTWAPVIGDAFLPQSLSEVTATRGRTNIAIGWGMYNLHEGENFIPPGLANATGTNLPGNTFNSSEVSFESWVKSFLPSLSSTNLRQLLTEVYPAHGTAELLPTYNTTYTRAGLIFRDLVLACPTYWISVSAPKTGYLGEYAIPPATHAADVYYWNVVDDVQTEDPVIYEGFTGAFASFIQTGDPNAHKLTNHSQAAVPELSSIHEFVIQSNGLAETSFSQLEARCTFWREVADQVPI